MPGPQHDSVESTAALLFRARDGDPQARERLFRRFLPLLVRWAHGRLPPWARDIRETNDLVQDSLIRALKKLHSFEPRGEGSFLAYLRAILLNQVRDDARRAKRRPQRVPVDDDMSDRRPSPLEQAIGRNTLDRYEQALAQLTEDQRQAVFLRLELGYSCAEVALALGRPTENAARQLIARGLAHLAEILDESE